MAGPPGSRGRSQRTRRRRVRARGLPRPLRQLLPIAQLRSHPCSVSELRRFSQRRLVRAATPGGEVAAKIARCRAAVHPMARSFSPRWLGYCSDLSRANPGSRGEMGAGSLCAIYYPQPWVPLLPSVVAICYLEESALWFRLPFTRTVWRFVDRRRVRGLVRVKIPMAGYSPFAVEVGDEAYLPFVVRSTRTWTRLKASDWPIADRRISIRAYIEHAVNER